MVQIAIDADTAIFEPGAEDRWSYSNTGYILLGLIIEEATGASYEANLQSRIFDPVGMDNTYLGTGVPAEGEIPEAYYTYPFDLVETDWNLSQAWAAGAIISTNEDMADFIEALYSGELFQSDETLAQMIADETGYALWSAFGDGYYYGYGALNKYGFLGHGGQTLGFQSDVGYDPEQDVTIVIWANSAENAMTNAAPIVAYELGYIDMISPIIYPGGSE